MLLLLCYQCRYCILWLIYSQYINKLILFYKFSRRNRVINQVNVQNNIFLNFDKKCHLYITFCNVFVLYSFKWFRRFGLSMHFMIKLKRRHQISIQLASHNVNINCIYRGMRIAVIYPNNMHFM